MNRHATKVSKLLKAISLASSQRSHLYTRNPYRIVKRTTDAQPTSLPNLPDW